MAYETRGIQVTSGSAVVHKFLDDGTVVLGNQTTGFRFSVSGSSAMGRTTNNVADVTKFNGVLRVPTYVGTTNTDVTILNTLAAAPEDYNGYIIYLNSSGLTAGANVGGVTVSAKAGVAFSQGHKWYFCRGATWDMDRFF
jgi:hypothetical protein